MADILSESQEIVKEAAAGIVKNASNPWWVIGFLLIGFCTFFCVGTVVVGIYGAKPLIDAQLESVKASTEAIKSNAETSRQTGKAIVEIRDMMDRQVRRTEDILGNTEQALRDHQSIMGTLRQQCLPEKPKGLRQ